MGTSKKERPGRFFRWVPRGHAEEAIKLGFRSHNGSAMWVFDLTKEYRPGRSIYQGACLVAYTLDGTAADNLTTREHIDFESEDYEGEKHHPTKIITKNNEVGAYGVGKMRQGLTNLHVIDKKFATKAEVAKALGRHVLEVDAWEPPGGWPK